MILEDLARKRICEDYRSVRGFAEEIGMPYSTLTSGLTRGIKTMTLENANLVLDTLNLWQDAIQQLTNETEVRGEKNEAEVRREKCKALEDNLLAAYACITIMDTDPEKTYAVAIKEAEKECGQSLEAYQALIPKA